MKVKNLTAQKFAINKTVQIDTNTPNADDGYILPGQVLDLSKSLTFFNLADSEQLRQGIYSGELVFVINGLESEQAESVQVYDAGVSEWAKIFDPKISQTNLYEGLASGFLYVKNCLIG
jgi:hypothetical protein